MNPWGHSFNARVHMKSIGCCAAEYPFQSISLIHNALLVDLPQDYCVPIVPENYFAKGHSEGQVINQSFECGCRTEGIGEKRVRPPPERPMPITAVVPLDAKTHRIALHCIAIEVYFSAENRIGMGRFRKSDPPFVTQHRSEIRLEPQVPGNAMPVNPQISPTPAFFDAVFRDLTIEGKSLSSAQR